MPTSSVLTVVCVCPGREGTSSCSDDNGAIGNSLAKSVEDFSAGCWAGHFLYYVKCGKCKKCKKCEVNV